MLCANDRCKIIIGWIAPSTMRSASVVDQRVGMTGGKFDGCLPASVYGPPGSGNEWMTPLREFQRW